MHLKQLQEIRDHKIKQERQRQEAICSPTILNDSVTSMPSFKNSFLKNSSNKYPRFPQSLTKSQKENIKVAVASDPNAFGYTVWDGPSLSDYNSAMK